MTEIEATVDPVFPRIAARSDPGPAAQPTAGVLVLENDMVSEAELRIFLSGTSVGLFATRIPMALEGTPATLAAMESYIADAARRLLPAERLDLVIFSCTAGAAVISPSVVTKRVHEGRGYVPVVTPLQAAVDALRALRASKIAVLTPYTRNVHPKMIDHYRASGFDVVSHASFDAADEAAARRISPDCIAEAAISLGRGEADAVFISCTALRCSNAIERVERELGKPVVTSNQASAWRALQIVRQQARSAGIGQLLRDNPC